MYFKTDEMYNQPFKKKKRAIGTLEGRFPQGSVQNPCWNIFLDPLLMYSSANGPSHGLDADVQMFHPWNQNFQLYTVRRFCIGFIYMQSLSYGLQPTLGLNVACEPCN